jgi:CBS domain-containing protein
MGLLRLGQRSPEISPGASVMDAVRTMTEESVGALAVTAERRVVGIFTERDLMRRVIYAGKDPRATPIRDVMTAPVQTVSDSITVAEAAAIMRARRIRHLAVVDDEGQLMGMVAQRFLLYDMLNDLERKADDLQGYLMADGPGG